MLDQMTDQWGLAKLPVVGDSGCGDATEFRLGLHERGFAYVLEVELRIGASDGLSMVTVPPANLTPEWMKRLTEQGYQHPVVAVVVCNVGWLPVTVQRWSIKHTRGVAMTPMGSGTIGATLPYRLEAGESQTWATDLETAVDLKRAALAALKAPARPTTIAASVVVSTRGRRGEGLFGVVELGDGRVRETRQLLP